MGNLESAFRYPFSGEGWGSKFALGGVLFVLGGILGFIPWVGGFFWVLIAFLPLGYAYRIFRDHFRGAEGPPPVWGEWSNLFTQGLFVFLISLGYGIIPGILLWLGKVFWDGGGFGAFVGVLFLVLGAGILLVASFLLPMALAFFARENESFAAAFRWSGLVEKIWVVQREYFIGWLVSLVLFLILFFVRANFLYVGWILYALGIFYLSLVMARYFGRVCWESIDSSR